MSIIQEQITDQTDAVDVVDRWITEVADALSEGSESRLEDLLTEDAVLRDLVSLTGTIGKHYRAGDIAHVILGAKSAIVPESLRISTRFTAPKFTNIFGRDVLEAYIEFDTGEGHSVAVVRLITGFESPRAWLLLTSLRSLTGGGKQVTTPYGERYGFDRRTPTENWSEYRARRQAFEDREPEVLVVGGGHNGVVIAAQLEHLGVDTLLVDRLPRLGDVWRNRYHALALHMVTESAHLPIIPFPDTFPEYLSKDQFADWIESYARTLEVNAWNSTSLVRARYDDEEHAWEATVLRNGEERVLHPRHIVMATGFIGNIPRIPELPGLDDFSGPVVHTAHFKDGIEFAGKRVLVVGAGTSAHDVAQELIRYDSKVTLVQRSPVDIVRLETMEKRHLAQHNPGAGLDEIDLQFAANLVFPHLAEQLRADRQNMLQEDAELLERLEKVGFRVDKGPDGPWFAALRNGQGYYIDVGASELVADGTAKVVQSTDLQTFTAEGVSLSDGTDIPFDAVVLATGFHNSITDIAKYFGQEVADALGIIHILDDEGDGEWKNSWVETAQPGLWFTSAGPTITRTYSNYLALQLCQDLRNRR